MIYMGSKARIANHILPIILRNRTENQYYVEPFCGGCNTIDKVSGNRIASDINPYLIHMWKSVSNGWMPTKEYTEEDYNYVKNNRDYNPTLTGYFGFALSFGGKFFGGWRRCSKNRDYVLNAYDNAVKQFPKLIGVEFYNSSYEELIIPSNSIIYCDIPYRNTTKYYNKVFNHDSFYDWCVNMKRDGHELYISEYAMPSNFTCVWEGKVSNCMNKLNSVEKLFTL